MEMTEQEKRDRVIEGLKRILHSGKMYEAHLVIDTCEAALALLKEQEPKVLTLEEYEAWIDTPFTERNPVFYEELTKRGTVTSWVNTTVCSLREYGKNDRCWTSRPSDEQRRNTPWT